MIKNQFRVAIMCLTFMLSFFFSQQTQTNIFASIGLIKTAEKKLDETLKPFAQNVVKFLPKDFIKKAGGQEKAIQLIINHKHLVIYIWLTSKLIHEIESELRSASQQKKLALAIPVRLIRSRKKQKQKKLLALENQYPELQEIGLVRWIIQPFLNKRLALTPAFFELIDKLRPKEEAFFAPQEEGLIEKAKKKFDKTIGSFALAITEFVPGLAAKAGGKKKAAKLIIKHKQLQFGIGLTQQLIKEIESELTKTPSIKKSGLERFLEIKGKPKKATSVKKMALKILLRLLTLEKAQEQEELKALEKKNPELVRIGLIRWMVRQFLGGSLGLIPAISQLLQTLESKRKEIIVREGITP